MLQNRAFFKEIPLAEKVNVSTHPNYKMCYVWGLNFTVAEHALSRRTFKIWMAFSAPPMIVYFLIADFQKLMNRRMQLDN